MKFRHVTSLALLPGLLGFGVAAGPALADARQDVLAASQRCAGFADDRTWLDCYYGAAQPMRAQLGLPPAPAAQLRLVPQAAAAAPPPYGVPAPAYMPGATDPRIAAVAPPPEKRKSGGFWSSMFGGKPLVSNMRLRSFARDKNGQLSVTLADGEVWRLDEFGDNDQPQWRGAPSRYVVNIYEGALGSYNMEVSDDSHLYKVHRIS